MNLFLTIAHAAEATHQATESTGGIGALGIDGRILLYQILNFAVLLFVLYKVAYKPILKVLEERRKKIQDSLDTASRIETQQKELENEQKEILTAARKKAQSIIETSEREAQSIISQAEKRAISRSEQVMQEAQARIEQSLQEARRNLRQDVIDLVALATEQVLQEKIDPQKDVELIENSLARMSGKG